MARVFYVSIGMASTIHGSLELGRRLAERGHQVTYLSHADIGDDVAAAGFQFVRLTATAALSARAAELSVPARQLAPGAWLRWWRGRRALRRASLQGDELTGHLADADCVLLDVECHYAILCTADLDLPRVLINFFFDVRFSPRVPPLSVGLSPPETPLETAMVSLAVQKARAENRLWLWRQYLSRPGLARMVRAAEYWTYYHADLRALARTHKVSWRRDVDTAQWLRPAVYPGVPELCLNLEELDFPNPDGGGPTYVGPILRTDRPEPRLSPEDRARWEAVRDRHQASNGACRLVYCSFGTFYGANDKLLRQIVAAFARRQDWQLVLGLGGRRAPEFFDELPVNVTVLGWAPQIEVLAVADCAIEHGGISGANECVRQQVPLLFYDGGQIDQPGVVARLVHHGVAVRGDAVRDDSVAIEQRIESLCDSEAIRARLEYFAGRMMQHEQEHTAAVQIERVIGEVDAAAGP